MLVDRLAPSTLEENPLWLVVLCDMMTNLMLFFLVMYAMMQQSPSAREQFLRTFDTRGAIAKDAPAPSVPAFREEDAAERLTALFAEAGLADSAEVSETRDTVRVRLSNQVLFPTASAELEPGAEPALAALAAVLRELPNEVIVEGHTDTVPITKAPYASNWELSVARSYAVVSRLLAAGIPPRRLVAAGYGEYRPLAPNADADGRARNRRVEVVIPRCPEGRSAADCLGAEKGS